MISLVVNFHYFTKMIERNLEIFIFPEKIHQFCEIKRLKKSFKKTDQLWRMYSKHKLTILHQCFLVFSFLFFPISWCMGVTQIQWKRVFLSTHYPSCMVCWWVLVQSSPIYFFLMIFISFWKPNWEKIEKMCFFNNIYSAIFSFATFVNIYYLKNKQHFSGVLIMVS